MHLFGSITGCKVGGSVMLAAIASSAALMLASSRRRLEMMYQTKIPTIGNRYRLSNTGFIELFFLRQKKS